MQGYWHKPAETRAVTTDDGWFRTGDIGRLDADGFLTITDRKKELLKTSGGKYIAPQPSSTHQRVALCKSGRGRWRWPQVPGGSDRS